MERAGRATWTVTPRGSGERVGRRANQFIAKCGDSLRELEETAYWLELLVDGKIVSPEKLTTLRQECDELAAIFVTILKRSKEDPS
jgi:four helix bundle protein